MPPVRHVRIQLLTLSFLGHNRSSQGLDNKIYYWKLQLTQLSQILRVVEKERPHIKFNFQEHLLGGVRIPD